MSILCKRSENYKNVGDEGLNGLYKPHKNGEIDDVIESGYNSPSSSEAKTPPSSSYMERNSISFIPVKERIKFFSDMKENQRTEGVQHLRFEDSAKTVRAFNFNDANQTLPEKLVASSFVKEKVNRFNNIFQNSGIAYKIKINPNLTASKMSAYFGNQNNVSSKTDKQASGMSPSNKMASTAQQNENEKSPSVSETVQQIENSLKTVELEKDAPIKLDLNKYKFKPELGKESPTFKDILQRIAHNRKLRTTKKESPLPESPTYKDILKRITFNREQREKEKGQCPDNSLKFRKPFMNEPRLKTKQSVPLIRKSIRRPENTKTTGVSIIRNKFEHHLYENWNIEKSLDNDLEEYRSGSSNLRRFSSRILTEELEENDESPFEEDLLYEYSRNLENWRNEENIENLKVFQLSDGTYETFSNEFDDSFQTHIFDESHFQGLLENRLISFKEPFYYKRVISNSYANSFETIEEEDGEAIENDETVQGDTTQKEKEDKENEKDQDEKVANNTNFHKDCPSFAELIEETGKMCITLGSKLLDESKNARYKPHNSTNNNKNHVPSNQKVFSDNKKDFNYFRSGKGSQEPKYSSSIPHKNIKRYEDLPKASSTVEHNLCISCEQTMSEVIENAVKETVNDKFTTNRELNGSKCNEKSWKSQSFIKNLVEEFVQLNQQLPNSYAFKEKRMETYQKILNEISIREKRLKNIGEELSVYNEIVKEVIDELSFHSPIY